MMFELLEREAVRTDGPTLESTVLKDAYTELRYAIGVSERTRSMRAQAVSEVLAACKIQPFTDQSVRRHVRRQTWAARVPWLVLSSVAAAGMFWLAFYVGPGGWLVVSGIPLTLVCVLGFVIAGNAGHWSSARLSSTTERVPEFVLLTALTVNRAFQARADQFLDVEFYVRCLESWREHMDARRRLRAASDPFLVLMVNGRGYYLEAWDEPGFDRQRKI